jgi:excisionase family DNA binding protein
MGVVCLDKLQENYVTTTEAARIIKKTADLIAKLCQSGRLPGAEKIGNTWLIPRASVESYTPGKRGPRTNREKLAADLAGMRKEIAASKGEHSQ